MDPDKKTLLARSIASMSRHMFSSFIEELFGKDRNYYEGMLPLTDAGEDVFYRPFLDSYGGSIHEVLLLHFPPLELFPPSKPFHLDDPTLVRRITKVKKLYRGRKGYWGLVDPVLRKDDALNNIKLLTNLFGMQREIYEQLIIPAYSRLLSEHGLSKVNIFVGSSDSFLDLNPEGTEQAWRHVVESHGEGLTISMSDRHVKVGGLMSQRALSAGASPGTRCAYESVFVSRVIQKRAVLAEFEALINSDESESKFEEFLFEHYQELLGSKYDRIERQLWLRFSELDIQQRDRRLDMFVRNSITNDWELVEVKRPIRLVRTYRDIPVIVNEVKNAIHQVSNYARLLRQDAVKRHFANEGIRYYEPVLNLVIGRSPQIPLEQWRSLKSQNENNLKIFTYDELLKELNHRCHDQFALYEQLLGK